MVSSTARMKHAGLLWHTLDADVEPHRAVERCPLGDQDVLQLVVERIGLGLVGEVAAFDAPGGDGVGHAIDDLLERPLALGKAQRAAEVLLRHDVGGIERPVGGELDAQLLERNRAVLPVGDPRVATLPLDLVVRVNPGAVKWRVIPMERRSGANDM